MSVAGLSAGILLVPEFSQLERSSMGLARQVYIRISSISKRPILPFVDSKSRVDLRVFPTRIIIYLHGAQFPSDILPSNSELTILDIVLLDKDF